MVRAYNYVLFIETSFISVQVPRFPEQPSFMDTMLKKIVAKNTALALKFTLIDHDALCRKDTEAYLRFDNYPQRPGKPGRPFFTYFRAKYNPYKITPVPAKSQTPIASPSRAPMMMVITGNKKVTEVAKIGPVRCMRVK